MKKLAIVGALAALAWAQGVGAASTQETKAEAQEKADKAEAKAREETREAQADAQKKTAEAQTAATGATSKTGEKKHSVFEGKNNFEVKGKIASVSASSITVRRDELPPAKLRVDSSTKIELDGQYVSASQLKQGQEVKASFNLQNDKPMAVEIEAEKAK